MFDAAEGRWKEIGWDALGWRPWANGAGSRSIGIKCGHINGASCQPAVFKM